MVWNSCLLFFFFSLKYNLWSEMLEIFWFAFFFRRLAFYAWLPIGTFFVTKGLINKHFDFDFPFDSCVSFIRVGNMLLFSLYSHCLAHGRYTGTINWANPWKFCLSKLIICSFVFSHSNCLALIRNICKLVEQLLP